MRARTGRIWLRLLLVSAASLSLILCGCDDEDTDTDITPTRFNVDRELWNYSDTDEFPWDTTLRQALMMVRVENFREGDMAVRVYDAAGNPILYAVLNTWDSAYYVDEDFYFQQRTDVGVPGQWRVVLDYHHVTGDISITME